MLLKSKFHSFDALRSLSFLIVFFSHLPFEILPKSFLNLLDERGYIGVEFFFTLSGFLITYILLYEKKVNHEINFKNFIVRRILRIWPLFYVMILFAFVSPYLITYLGLSYSEEGYAPNFLLSCLFLENYQTIIHNQFPNVMPLPVFWSLCVEEHFYIIWGITLYFANLKKVPYFIALFIIIPTISRWFFMQNGWMMIDLSTNFDFFMCGAIPAYCYLNYQEKTNRLVMATPNWVKVSILLFTLILIFYSGQIDIRYFPMIEPLVFALLFGAVLFIFLPSEGIFRIGDNNVLSKLGIYTYGLYLTHFIGISFVKKVFEKLHFTSDYYLLIFIICSLSLTILASYIAYHVIEKPFLKLKKYFN